MYTKPQGGTSRPIPSSTGQMISKWTLPVSQGLLISTIELINKTMLHFTMNWGGSCTYPHKTLSRICVSPGVYDFLDSWFLTPSV